MTKFRRRLIIVLAISALAIPMLWLGVQRSDAYRAAVTYIGQDPKVRAHLGELQDVDLPLFGYSIRISGARGDANFTLDLTGSRASATAYVELSRQGAWQATVSRLVLQDGTVVDLTP